MSMQSFAPLMFAGLIFIMLIGFPVAFSLSALGLLCGFIAIEAGWFPASFMSNLPINVFGILSNDLLQVSDKGVTVTPPDPYSNNQKIFVPREQHPTKLAGAIE